MNSQEERTLEIICCLNMAFLIIPMVFILLVRLCAYLIIDNFDPDSFNFQLNPYLYFMGVLVGGLWLIDQDLLSDGDKDE